MYNNNIFKNKEKGVSLITTFFILTIILAVVLSISILLYNEVKIIRNIGNSVVAFYVADSGVEKLLYYDRKELPVVEDIIGERGLCNICEVCSDCMPGTHGGPGDCVEADCQGCNRIGQDCDLLTCEECEVSFKSFFDDKNYEVIVETSMIDDAPNTSIESESNYQNVSRKIQLQIVGE